MGNVRSVRLFYAASIVLIQAALLAALFWGSSSPVLLLIPDLGFVILG